MSTQGDNFKEIAYVLHPQQISGKEPKLLSRDGSKILKGFVQCEEQFYIRMQIQSNMLSPTYSLTQFLPKYFGTVQFEEPPQILQSGSSEDSSSLKKWIAHLKDRYFNRGQNKKFIVLENLSLNFKDLSSLDLKLGPSVNPTKESKLVLNQAAQTYKFRINGCSFIHEQKQRAKYFFHKYNTNDICGKEDILFFLGIFFSDGEALLSHIVESALNQLKDLILAFKSLNECSLFSSSILFLYDRSKILVRLIDFGRYTSNNFNSSSKAACEGMENIVQFLSQLLQHREQFNLKIKAKSDQFIGELLKKSDIPSKKLLKYSPKKKGQSKQSIESSECP